MKQSDRIRMHLHVCESALQEVVGMLSEECSACPRCGRNVYKNVDQGLSAVALRTALDRVRKVLRFVERKPDAYNPTQEGTGNDQHEPTDGVAQETRKRDQ